MSLAKGPTGGLYIFHELSTGSAELGEFFLFVGAYTVGWFDFENSNHGRPHDQTSYKWANPAYMITFRENFLLHYA